MTAQPQGRPLWLDLFTHDTAGAQAFYSELFGWDFEDRGEEFGHYTLIRKDGHLVGGMMSSLWGPGGPTSEPQGPTCWTVYLHTPNLDRALAAMPGVGGRIVFGPMDVADQGRQAMVVDPAGAHLGLWQPEAMGGFDLPLVPGTPVWFESLTKDLDAVLPFYRDVLGWDVHWMGGGEGGEGGGAEGGSDGDESGFRYATNGGGEHAVAGLCDASSFLPEAVPSSWRAYLAVADADATAARITELGGSVQEAPADSPFGRFAQVADPQGAVFMINQAPGADVG